MAIFFMRKTVDEAVDAELGKAQRRLQQQVVAHPQAQAVWEQHAETCTAAKEGLVVVERMEGENGAALYGKSDVTVTCSCKQVMYTFDEKGNLKIQEAKQNTETTRYVNIGTSPSSLYRDNQK